VTFTGKLSQVNAAFRTVFESAVSSDPAAFNAASYMGGMGVTGSSGTVLKLLVGNAQAGAVIGKGGEGIKRIRSVSGATVKVLAVKDMPPGVRRARCLVCATAAASVLILLSRPRVVSSHAVVTCRHVSCRHMPLSRVVSCRITSCNVAGVVAHDCSP
jgi:hypothetical protein